jgi:hypothetical protein
MDISFSECESACILHLHTQNLNPKVLIGMRKIIEKMPTQKPIAMNFEKVNFVCQEFLPFLQEISKDKILSIFNINSELMAILDLTKYSKFVKIYTNENDFMNNKHSIVNRKFHIVGNS